MNQWTPQCVILYNTNLIKCLLRKLLLLLHMLFYKSIKDYLTTVAGSDDGKVVVEIEVLVDISPSRRRISLIVLLLQSFVLQQTKLQFLESTSFKKLAYVITMGVGQWGEGRGACSWIFIHDTDNVFSTTIRFVNPTLTNHLSSLLCYYLTLRGRGDWD